MKIKSNDNHDPVEIWDTKTTIIKNNNTLFSRLSRSLLCLLLLAPASNILAEKRGDTKDNEGWRILERQKWFQETRGLNKKSDAKKLMQKSIDSIKEKRTQTRLRAMGNGEIWQEMGPSSMDMSGWSFGRVSGRNNAIVAHPDDENILYFGAATGGVWKSTNGGAQWQPVFDEVGTQSIGSIYLDPSDPNRVWVGTGDKNSGSCAGYLGNGVFLSTDAGNSWSNKNGQASTAMPLEIVNSVVVSPNDSNLVLAGGFGYCDDDGYLRGGGIYRTTNGGESWVKVYTGKVEDMVFAPDGNSVYAGVPGVGVVKSTNKGASFSNASSGLYASDYRMRIAMAPSNSQVLYALGDNRRLYRTSNGASSWSLMNSNACEGQCSYNLALSVNPSNPNTLLVGSIRHAISTNGGSSLSYLTSGWGTNQKVHQDTHTLTWSKTNSNRYWVGTDGGIWRSDNKGNSFSNLNANLNVTQFYDIAVDFSSEGKIFGGAQDNSSSARFEGTSNVWDLTYASGDGFMNVIDQSNPNVVLQTSYPNGGLPWIIRSTTGGGPGSFSQMTNSGIQSSQYFPWVTPLASAGNRVWVASNRVYVATTSSSSGWSALSGSLGSSASVLTPVLVNNSYTLLVGTSEGRIYKSTNPQSGGATLSNVTGNYPGGRVTDIAIDLNNTQRIFVSRGGFGGTRLYLSNTGGNNWTALGNGLPNVPTNAVAIDPKNSQRIFVGTDVGVYESKDGGENFNVYDTGMPLGSVITDLEIENDPHLLFAATYGRGAWKVELNDGQQNTPPIADFNFSINELTVNFTDQSSDSDGHIASWSWDFGDGTQSTESNPRKTYASSGDYDVELTVTDDGGSTSRLTKRISIVDGNEQPTANFSARIDFLTVTFTDQSSDSDGDIISRDWDFGDNTYSTETHPEKTYASAGTYSVTLTVVDDDGAKHSLVKQITVNSENTAPVANFNFIADGLNVTFTDLSTDSDGHIVAHQWDFGDKTSSNESNPEKVYESSGSYTVALTVLDDQGSKNTFSRLVEVSEIPANLPPAANYSYVADQLSVRFTDTSTDSDGNVVKWFWRFGDGEVSSSQNPSHAYSREGEYNVELSVTDNENATNTITKSVVVTSSACAGTTVNGAFSGSNGQTQIQPNGTWFYSNQSRSYSACLSGPTNADFDIYLDKWSDTGWGNWGWVRVAAGESPNSEELINYQGSAGYYRYRVTNYSGTGSYRFTFN